MLNVLFRKNDTLKLELQFNSLVLYVNSSNNLVGLSLVKTSQIWKKIQSDAGNTVLEQGLLKKPCVISIYLVLVIVTWHQFSC